MTGCAVAEAIQARALVVLDLEQLDQPGRLAGRRCHPQLAARVGQHHPGRRHGEQRDAAVGEEVQEVDHVEIGDHGVRQVDECAREQLGVLRLPCLDGKCAHFTATVQAGGGAGPGLVRLWWRSEAGYVALLSGCG